MKKKTIWLVASCVIVAALLLVSCAPAPTEEEEVTPPAEEEEVVQELPATETPTTPPPPAEFEVVSLDIQPPEVMAGEAVSITVEVKNTGGSEGTYTAVLIMDGEETETKNVTIPAGTTEAITFSLVKDAAGIYSIGLAGLTGAIIVKDSQELPSGYIVEKTLCFENSQIEIYHITYMSDGLQVKGYLAQPKAPGTYPALIHNRGGNLEFGKLTCSRLMNYASYGFVAVGSQYRGNDGGEGREEFGGADVNDVLNLIPLLKSLPNVDADKIGMVGYSRGGMMTYLALKEQTLRGTDDIKAACTVGGVADLFMSAEERPEMVTGVYIPLIGGTPSQLPQEYEARSATYWADKINVPLLIQHGEADWRVSVEQARKLAQELERYGKDYKLITYPGDDHSLSGHNKGLYEILSWLSENLDISINLESVAFETPNSTESIEEGEIAGGYYIHEEKGYKIAVPPQKWVANFSAPPLDVIFQFSQGSAFGWMGVGAYSSASYTESFFDNINDWWVSAMSTKGGWTDIKIVDERDLTIAGHNAKVVAFEYTSGNKRYVEMTYHIWKPKGIYNLHRVRMNCDKDKFDEFLDVYEVFVNSFSFLP